VAFTSTTGRPRAAEGGGQAAGLPYYLPDGVDGRKLRLARRTTIARMPATIAQSVIRWTS
jgi:hypothetical protein